MAKEFFNGNHAIAEAAIRAGCRFYAGYPITPQSEIVEYMSWRLDEVGGSFTQTESEIAAVSMLYGAASCGVRGMITSSGPGFDLFQEGISYLASAEVPAVIVDVMRYGNGLGHITPGQGDYLQAVKNGGHGDYRCIVLAPSTMQDAVDLIGLAFDLAEKYRNPVIMLTDGATAQMMESVEFPEMREHDPDQFDWSLKGAMDPPGRNVMNSRCYTATVGNQRSYVGRDYDRHIQERYGAMREEVRWEEFETGDADVVLVAYGITHRICKEAVMGLRKQGVKVGIVRPITLWPFPVEPFRRSSAKAIISVEMCALPQLAEDVALAVRGRTPVYAMTTGSFVADEEEIAQFIEDSLAGKKTEV